MKANELITLIKENNEEVTTINDLNDLIDATLSAETVEETVEETEEAAEETTEEAEEEPVETELSAEETEETEETEEVGEQEPDLNLSAIMGIVNDLRADNERLRLENQNLTAQLSARNKAEKDFIEKFKNLSVSIREEEKKPVETKNHQLGMTNGIGEL